MVPESWRGGAICEPDALPGVVQSQLTPRSYSMFSKSR